VRGGSAGILAAIAAGWLDPLDARLPDERPTRGMTPKLRRELARRARRRARALAIRSPF
jgi:hypothetical protein